jgi:hypothetical protein
MFTALVVLPLPLPLPLADLDELLPHAARATAVNTAAKKITLRGLSLM